MQQGPGVWNDRADSTKHELSHHMGSQAWKSISIGNLAIHGKDTPPSPLPPPPPPGTQSQECFHTLPRVMLLLLFCVFFLGGGGGGNQCSLQKFSYTWCKINKCQLAKKLHMVLINLHLVLAILFGLQCVLKV